MQPLEPTPRPRRPLVPDVPSFPQGLTNPSANLSAPPENASEKEMISYLMQREAYHTQRDAYQQELNKYQQELNKYQQELNRYFMADSQATKWDISEIHNKFNMREAMEK